MQPFALVVVVVVVVVVTVVVVTVVVVVVVVVIVVVVGQCLNICQTCISTALMARLKPFTEYLLLCDLEAQHEPKMNINPKRSIFFHKVFLLTGALLLGSVFVCIPVWCWYGSPVEPSLLAT